MWCVWAARCISSWRWGRLFKKRHTIFHTLEGKNRHLFNFPLSLELFLHISLLFVIDNVTCNYCPFPGTGCQSLRSKKPAPVCLYPCQQGRVSTHWFLPEYLLHLTKSSGVMPDFSYDKGDEGITDKAGWLKQFSSFSLLISIIAASKIFRNFWARLLENCWDCFVLFSNMLYQPMEEDVIVVAVFHQGMPHCQWRKTVWCHLKYIVQINGQGSALPNTTAVIFFLSLHSWFK